MTPAAAAARRCFTGTLEEYQSVALARARFAPVRDVDRLRARVIAALAVTPVSVATLACDSDARAEASRSAAAPAVQSADNPTVLPTPYPPGQKWCSTTKIAWKIAVANSPDEHGCPKFVKGPYAKDRPENDPYAGIGYDVIGYWDPIFTGARRSDGQDNACCYNWRDEEGKGRPLFEGDAVVVAELEPGTSWNAEPVAVAPVDPTLASRLAAEWIDDALAEHASVASFARATLELMAHAAPAHLLEGCQRAALDEVRHAKLCFALAAAYGAAATCPGRLASPPPRSFDLASLAASTFREGCVAETTAALAAERALSRCRDPAVRRVLGIIAEDEARHAVLAWRTVAWALGRGGRGVAGALRAEAARRRPRASVASCTNEGLGAYGRLDEESRARVSDDAWREVVEPALAAALSARRPRASA